MWNAGQVLKNVNMAAHKDTHTQSPDKATEEAVGVDIKETGHNRNNRKPQNRSFSK